MSPFTARQKNAKPHPQWLEAGRKVRGQVLTPAVLQNKTAQLAIAHTFLSSCVALFKYSGSRVRSPALPDFL